METHTISFYYNITVLVLFEESEYGNAVKYIADFVYWDITQNTQVVEDVKGYRTPEYKLKKRIMAEKLGIDILAT